jgi:hypothetical protein
MPAGKRKVRQKMSSRGIEFDGSVYDLVALRAAAEEFGPETGAVSAGEGGRILVEFCGDDGLELEFRNLALLRTIEEKKSR